MKKSDLICSSCGNILSIVRAECEQKKLYHIEDYWCPVCKKITRHIELKELDKLKAVLQYKLQLTQQDIYVSNLLEGKSDEKVFRKTFKLR